MNQYDAKPDGPSRTASTRTTPVGRDSFGYQLNYVAHSARLFLERRLRAHGASFATWRTLELLAQRGPMIQGELAETLGVRGPTATRGLDRLVSEGLVRRRRLSTDRRKAEITLTETGARLHERLAGVIEEANAALAYGIPRQDLDTLRALLDLVCRNAEEEPDRQVAAEP
ncbi:MarR family winged helix-turn-helix transcriptional regulator [Streptomyces oceani]|uniref:MarR family winged helix-turn-helix transcriptional regulator n=1 Tax=Streptomyces oceani TaxID=1075402 RepID=UPI00147AB514|nr:MarR family winged helix-turn-helix transcriptional regulator [Streptomyces oceani]